MSSRSSSPFTPKKTKKRSSSAASRDRLKQRSGASPLPFDLCLLSSSSDDLSDAGSSDMASAPGTREFSNLTSCSKLSASSEDLRLIGTERPVLDKRKSRTLTFRRKKPAVTKEPQAKETPRKDKKKFWTSRLRKRLPVRLRRGKDHGLPDAAPAVDAGTCVCTGYRRTEDHTLGAGIVFAVRAAVRASANASPLQNSTTRSNRLSMGAGPGPTGIHASMLGSEMLQLVPAPSRQIGAAERPEDPEELLKVQRALDMELGIEISGAAGHCSAYPHLHYTGSHSPTPSLSSSAAADINELPASGCSSLVSSFHSQCLIAPPATFALQQPLPSLASLSPSPSSSSSEPLSPSQQSTQLAAQASFITPTVHTQVDYIHCMVPDLLAITRCSFYWGVMDRYEAERLLDGRPEGTFLLRDSAQEEFLFSVSFRRYGRSLHARIEQWNHKFSFDSHDPGVFASDTVCGLIEHYKDPSCCMFFEPMLTLPLHRSFPFSLQHLCRAAICDRSTYDGINFIPLPKPLKEYLKYYHYKQKVRVRRFEIQH